MSDINEMRLLQAVKSVFTVPNEYTTNSKNYYNILKEELKQKIEDYKKTGFLTITNQTNIPEFYKRQAEKLKEEKEFFASMTPTTPLTHIISNAASKRHHTYMQALATHGGRRTLRKRKTLRKRTLRKRRTQ